jgi:hypothetical protein
LIPPPKAYRIKINNNMNKQVYAAFDGTGEFSTPNLYKIFAKQEDAINFIIDHILLKNKYAAELAGYNKKGREDLAKLAKAYIEEFEVN